LECLPIRPDPGAQIHFKAAKDTGKHTNQDCRQQDIAFGILNVFSQGCNTIETNVSQGGKRSRSPNAVTVEGCGIIERLNGKQSTPALISEKVTHCEY